ncbi:unnamed protein product [Pleuronectes platessa]|uniref:G-protein coupled receptors family 2 profile 2 domain-containing protein n=1 Tax=Pleuronectes platessa TaxID=8262 RepID=A0A9N7VUX1_PLEPL|nr:unnamed protein product [Pleuronectes platessa]
MKLKPEIPLFPSGDSLRGDGHIYRNCTEDGWSEAFPPYEDACEFAEDEETEPEEPSESVEEVETLHSRGNHQKPPGPQFNIDQDETSTNFLLHRSKKDKGQNVLVKTTYFSNFKQVYTAGYATSLISLISAIFVFTVFRKFHCTRNYIHINLFFSFILRASAVFIKDGVLFSDENLDHCFMSTTSCKSAVAFFQFSILANYFWLLVEGMYLQTLLALTFVFQKKYFWWYILIGWGLPTTIISAWILTRNFYDNKGCWDDTDVDFVWWIIKAPITASLLVNFIIFINVIRILVQKLRSPGVGGNDTSHFKRLAKSTLLLIPLFGMHYMLFAFLPEATGAEARLFIELGVGSFQGFGVALLYCFLNGEVQAELKKRFWKWQTQNYLRYSKRRRTLFTESSTVTQISVLDKSSPRDQPGPETQALTHSVTATHNNVSTV